jgi:uncharacterized protein (DUF1697 family)
MQGKADMSGGMIAQRVVRARHRRYGHHGAARPHNEGMPAAQPFIGFIRGVNVGGNKKLKMDALRAACESLGLAGARTYLQSGNIVFRSAGKPAVLVKTIESAIREASGFEAKVILRTPDELRAVIAANPFAGIPDLNPSALLVAFLAGEIATGAVATLSALKTPAEHLHCGLLELYLYLPGGIADSKIASALTEKKIGVNVTARNWNTVNALLALSEE